MSTKRRALRSALLALLSALYTALVAAGPVAADGDVVCSEQPPILPQHDEYGKNCGESQDGVVWSCFLHNSGSLNGADVYPAQGPANNRLVVARDGDLTGELFVHIRLVAKV